jgi:ABC-type sulfate transport system permease subunit
MVCMCLIVYSCFVKNPSTRSELAPVILRWGCYREMARRGQNRAGSRALWRVTLLSKVGKLETHVSYEAILATI